jgi:tellurite resistance protein
MHIAATPDQARAILKAMYGIAAAGPQVTDADRASINAAARYIFRLNADPSVMTPASAGDLQALASSPALANEAVSFATVMALVDGTLDNAKLNAVLALAAKLGVKADYVDDVAELAQGHLKDATAHMIRANMESILGRPWPSDDMMAWFLPYKDKPDPALAARFHALADLPATTFGHTFATFYKANKYAFPGEPTALNYAFAAPHDSLHTLAGYETTPRGELLVSTFTAAMHRKRAMAGHVLPVILSWHLGIALNDVAGSAKGALDPQEFWHAWARGEAVKVDLFDPSWDFWAATRQPIDALRLQIGMPPN